MISFENDCSTGAHPRVLEALAAVCRRYEIPLYLDGARLAYGLTAPGTDVTLREVFPFARERVPSI